jgi:hypothetical protein
VRGGEEVLCVGVKSGCGAQKFIVKDHSQFIVKDHSQFIS